MVLTFLLITTLAFAQDAKDDPAPSAEQGAEAPTEAPAEAPKAAPVKAPDEALDENLDDWDDASDQDLDQWEDAPAGQRDDPELEDLDSELRGSSNRRRSSSTANPAMVGAAAGCFCGVVGCLGATIYYYMTDPPISSGSGVTLGDYSEEARKARAKQAFVGGTFGVATLIGVGVAFSLSGL
jgi:hypothetical protein